MSEVKPRATTPEGIAVWCGYTRLADPQQLKPWPDNVRRHPETQIRVIREVIRGNGWRRAITVSRRSGYVTRGNGALQTALEAGWTAVPVDEQDYESEQAELADLMADNRIQEFSYHDAEKLKDLAALLAGDPESLRLTGYDENVMAAILSDFKTGLTLDMSEQHAPEAEADGIRQVILVFYDAAEFTATSQSILRAMKRHAAATPSEAVLQALRQFHERINAETKAA